MVHAMHFILLILYTRSKHTCQRWERKFYFTSSSEMQREWKKKIKTLSWYANFLCAVNANNASEFLTFLLPLYWIQVIALFGDGGGDAGNFCHFCFAPLCDRFSATNWFFFSLNLCKSHACHVCVKFNIFLKFKAKIQIKKEVTKKYREPSLKINLLNHSGAHKRIYLTQL